MKKEVLIAIAIGFGLGLVITFGIWSANKAIKDSSSQDNKSISEVTPTPTEALPTPASLFLTIDSPQNNEISNKDLLNIKGSTIADAVLVILYNNGEKILQADETGNFSTDIGLTAGDNEITIRAYDREGNQTEQLLTVVYSTAEI